tara:strand:- start:2855 stop:3028 length:174 start_codon:yes stop_codon:yes gene_type:complete
MDLQVLVTETKEYAAQIVGESLPPKGYDGTIEDYIREHLLESIMDNEPHTDIKIELI